MGNSAVCFLRVNRSSCAAAMISFPTTMAAAASWKYAEMPSIFFELFTCVLINEGSKKNVWLFYCIENQFDLNHLTKKKLYTELS